MYLRYRHHTSLEELVRDLFRIFRQVLLVTDGNVEHALQLLEELGDRYGLWIEEFGIAEFRELLRRSGDAKEGGGGLRLTAKGERALRRQALCDVFQKLGPRGAGEHRLPIPGGAGDPTDETRPYEFGDPLETLDAGRTLENWLRRTGGAADPLERDLEVRERERAAACATVLLIDVSHSMTLYGEDRITPAKRVALALVELIRTRFPKDTIDVVLFGDEAQRVPVEKLPYVTNGPFHTNTRAGLVLAQEILARRRGVNRQIVLVTDGKPSAIHEEGRIYKNPFGLDRKIVARTIEEAARCRRKEIPITTFMLTAEPQLQRFVERFTEANRGRAYFASSDRLEGFVMVDFLRNRRWRV
jgi:Ca-activated chloride channel family protein